MQIRTFSLLALLVSFAACSSGTATDGGTATDASHADLGVADTGTAIDAAATDAPATDLGSGIDAATADLGTDLDAATADLGTPTDASRSDGPTTGDSGVCVGSTGLACDDTADGGVCPAGYDCNLGRCIPQGRETCGGFAGRPCPTTGHTECLYETGHGDVGTCFTPDEAGCLCAVASSSWSCS